MKYNTIITLLALLLSLSQNGIAQTPLPHGRLSFANGSSLLLREYKTNATLLSAVEQWINDNYTSTNPSSGYISITAYYTDNTPEAINQASTQASTLAAHLRKTSGDKEFRHTFHLQRTPRANQLEVVCMEGTIPEGENRQIRYTGKKSWINRTIAAYPANAFKNAPTTTPTLASSAPQKSEPTLRTKSSAIRSLEADIREMKIKIYYRFDKTKFDTTYLSNPSTLRLIDSIMNLQSARFIDSLRIIGYASPEGPVAYNQRLSHNRAEAMKAYLIKRYPKIISPQTIITEAGGENWDEFRQMAEKDEHLPAKEQLITILEDKNINDIQRQRKIEQINNGNLYKQYLLPRYYRYLRNGASLLFLYSPKMPAAINRLPMLLAPQPPIPASGALDLSHLTLRNLPMKDSSARYIRPIAIKSNLLGDLATLFNVEVEVPIGRHFSLMAEWNFPFWGGLGNAGGVAPLPAYSENYTMQLLAGGVEARYWFPRSVGLSKEAWKWRDYNPLTGWFVGLYGGVGLYDFQWMQHGMQGELFVNAGLTGGFAHPIAKHFHMEYSLGVGYLQTQYYNYTMKDGHKVVDIRDDGKYDRRQQSYLGPTKLKVSIVWIPQFKLKERRLDEKSNPTTEP